VVIIAVDQLNDNDTYFIRPLLDLKYREAALARHCLLVLPAITVRQREREREYSAVSRYILFSTINMHNSSDT
jgi:hypothetical protein